MAVPFNAASNAYASAAKLIAEANKGIANPAGKTEAGGGDFARMLSDSLQSVMDAGRTSDRKTMDLVNGKGDLVDVVTAVAQTEIAVESMVAVRDRVISAYEEIMRMPI
jgi:flagellar hook-basal body complex protein FliE